MRVLAADDDEGGLRVLERCLRSWGYEPVCTANGAEAWKILRREDAPRIVVLDWYMPGMSGLEVCRLLRATPHGEACYVLMLTGRNSKDDLIEALEAGADDFLSKPFHTRELQLRLARGVSLQTSRAAVALTAPPPGTPPSGTTLGKKYRLERKIGEGGMASVWLGVHLSLGINVAIKFMKPDFAETPDFASFEREARAAAQLRSAHIVRVYDHGIAHDGSPFLVMEYLAGESLADRIDRTGPQDPELVARVLEQIARALAEAHARGIVHRDVKPENILLVDDGEHGDVLAKLVDFGLARARSSEEARHGLLSGTPGYMAPEHLEGSVSPAPALDTWGLAATAFTALTGTLPFDGDSVGEIVEKVCSAPPPVPSHVEGSLPSTVDAWFARACARRPDERFASITELAAALTEAVRLGKLEPVRRSGVEPRSPLAKSRTAPTEAVALRQKTKAYGDAS